LLDLKLPFKNGHEVLSWIRGQSDLNPIPVIILSSSSEPVDLRPAYDNGVNSYVVEPATTAQLGATARACRASWLTENRFADVIPST
jgi:CheY-like chemotaxis protein